MKLVIGLGNPGKKYELTRHNAGFLALDHLLNDSSHSSCSKFQAEIKETNIEGQKVLFIYPQTFMNESGKAVREILDFYKLDPKDIIVLHDEVDLPLGTIRLTESSGSAGHNGIKSIIEHLGTQDFKRVRIGVESRENKEHMPTDVFVLSPFTEDELKNIPWEEIKNKVLEFLKS